MKLGLCLLLFSISSIAWIEDEFCKSVLEKIKTNNLDFSYSQQEIDYMKFCQKDGYNLLHLWSMYSKNIKWALFLIDKAKIPCDNYYLQRNPLMDAVSCENIESATILITLNPKLVNMIDAAHWNSLYWAVRVKNQDIIKLLIKNGANINQKDINGYKSKDYCESRKIKKLLHKEEKLLKSIY